MSMHALALLLFCHGKAVHHGAAAAAAVGRSAGPPSTAHSQQRKVWATQQTAMQWMGNANGTSHSRVIRSSSRRNSSGGVAAQVLQQQSVQGGSQLYSCHT